jgi:predicted transcriptional regulator
LTDQQTPDQQESLISLTADIVAAHVSNNSVAVGDLATLVQNVHAALATLGSTPAASPVAERREPAVSVRSSVKPDSITCLICGSSNKMLKRHLMTSHSLTPAEYRSEFGLKTDYPMVSPNYAETRRDLAKRIGLGSIENRGTRKPKASAKPKKQAA